MSPDLINFYKQEDKKIYANCVWAESLYFDEYSGT